MAVGDDLVGNVTVKEVGSMNRCPITYDLCDDNLYSTEGLKLLSPALKSLAKLDFSAEELRAEAMQRASKMSIQGV
jgi:serine/threonine-protein kinase HipA